MVFGDVLVEVVAIGIVAVAFLIAWAWLEGLFARKWVMAEANHQTQAADREARQSAELQWWIGERAAATAHRANEAKVLELLDSVGYDISVFKCSGCDGHFLRNNPKLVTVGSFEFCSEACRQHPLPFPALAPVASPVIDRALN
jgi:hypothetical protein